MHAKRKLKRDWILWRRKCLKIGYETNATRR